MTPQEELEKLAEEYSQNHYGHIAARFHGQTDFVPNPTIKAFINGFLALQEILQKVVDKQKVALSKEGYWDPRSVMKFYIEMVSEIHTEIEKWKEGKK